MGYWKWLYKNIKWLLGKPLADALILFFILMGVGIVLDTFLVVILAILIFVFGFTYQIYKDELEKVESR